jgi:hypothetical protein
MIILKRYHEFLSIFDTLGIEIEEMDKPRAGHIRIKCRHNDRSAIFYMSNSPSCSRSCKNFHGDVKRWFKGLDR